jgi:hypothetical protein
MSSERAGLINTVGELIAELQTHDPAEAGELRELIDGVTDDARVTITYDRGYNQFDPGVWSMSVNG